MIYKTKLTPDYFIRRAIKAQSIKEAMDANIGLVNLYSTHYRYLLNRWAEQMKSLGHPIFRF